MSSIAAPIALSLALRVAITPRCVVTGSTAVCAKQANAPRTIEHKQTHTASGQARDDVSTGSQSAEVRATSRASRAHIPIVHAGLAQPALATFLLQTCTADCRPAKSTAPVVLYRTRTHAIYADSYVMQPIKMNRMLALKLLYATQPRTAPGSKTRQTRHHRAH